jgi:hypothetical protein
MKTSSSFPLDAQCSIGAACYAVTGLESDWPGISGRGRVQRLKVRNRSAQVASDIAQEFRIRPADPVTANLY